MVGLIRIARRLVELIRGRDRSWKGLATLRRISWTLIADLVLLYVAASIAARADAIPLYYNTFVVFVLLIGAADVSWGLLGVESEEVPETGGR